MRYLIKILFLIISTYSYSQTNDSLRKSDFLTFETGLIMDGYNSMGVRTFFEYQKDLRKNWQFGISYEHSRHLGFVATDQPYSLETNLSLLSTNCYYKINLIRNRIFWTIGLGFGVVHADWEQLNDYDTYAELVHKNSFGATTNISISLNLRITKRIYIVTSPLIVFMPTNRAYFSTMNTDHFKNFYAVTFFPFGLKFKL